ncbi:type II toxin-antitoxin system Phd/YefM family antitoxin [Rhodobium gokarnense]|uniref:Antitoxin n=1 Tax=Rhodobium gokarnense TaxID=364296 RepID=A0ABT3HF08_9HYPH|nr:type II toxin-antitoxin system Phd/YefM family antitoxin [Rhodobium gokarnense]MCW2308981.1 prevent-host-death family protein [Rhodobium gokarnense]
MEKLEFLLFAAYIGRMTETGPIHMPSVSSTELIRKFGRYRDIARREPVTIVNHGRESLVLLSSEEYQRLKRRDREVLRLQDMDEGFLEALEKAEVPAEHAHLDDMLDDWKP